MLNFPYFSFRFVRLTKSVFWWIKHVLILARNICWFSCFYCFFSFQEYLHKQSSKGITNKAVDEDIDGRIHHERVYLVGFSQVLTLFLWSRYLFIIHHIRLGIELRTKNVATIQNNIETLWLILSWTYFCFI